MDPVAVVMNAHTYSVALRAALDAHAAVAASKLAGIVEHIPPRATEIEIVVFTDQDGEGLFDVNAGLVGPDLYVLNKAIEPYRDIFSANHDNIDHLGLPLFGRDPGFALADVIVDTVAAWLADVWTASDLDAGVDCVVLGHDGFGTSVPRVL